MAAWRCANDVEAVPSPCRRPAAELSAYPHPIVRWPHYHPELSFRRPTMLFAADLSRSRNLDASILGFLQH